MGVFANVAQQKINTGGVFSNVAQQQNQPVGETGLKGFATGVGKGILSTVKGAGQLGTKVGNIFLPKSLEIPDIYSEPALQQNAQQGGFLGKLLNKENLEPKSTSEKIGKFGEQVAEFAIPGTKVVNATKGAGLFTKMLGRGLTSGTIGAVQSGKVGQEAIVAGGIDAALPLASKVIVQPAKNLLGRLFKGLGGGLSGTPTNLIDDLIANPQSAKASIKELEKQGVGKILEQNSKTILNGVSSIKQNARKAFGEGLEQLSETDIQPSVFKNTIKTTLDKFGSLLKGGKRVLGNVEFDDPKNLAKASELINRLSNVKLDGKSLRKLADDVANSAYKTATSDERLAFNVFIKDLSATIKKAVSSSTNKLDDINKAFSTDMQLAEAVEDIFGSVNFRNLSEVLRASKKLETLFSQKGLAPEIIDTFLNKIGATGLKTSEATRQISTKVTGANVKGLSFGELLQNVTSAVVTPKTVRDASILTGIAKPKIKTVLNILSPSARGIFIKAAIGQD